MLLVQVPTVSTSCCSHCAEQRPAAQFQRHGQKNNSLFPHCMFCASLQKKLSSPTLSMEQLTVHLRPCDPRQLPHRC